MHSLSQVLTILLSRNVIMTCFFLFYDELIIQLNIASIYVNLSFRLSFPFSFMLSAFFGTIEVSNYYIIFL